MNRKFAFLAVLVIVSVVVTTSCRRGPSSSDLQGRWFAMSGDVFNFKGFRFQPGAGAGITFTGNNFLSESWGEPAARGSFTVRGERIVFSSPGEEESFRFTLSPDGRMLTLFEGDTIFAIFNRF